MSGTADRAMDQLFDLAVVLEGVMTDRLAEHGLTPARAEVLWVIHRGGPRTQRELSQILKCSPRNVTGLVDVLENAGFIERSAHPTDRRAVRVQLTKTGRDLLNEWEADRQHGTRNLLAGIAEGDLMVFSAVLDQVLERLRAAYNVPA